MDHQDLFYRAFTEYKKHTNVDAECIHFQKASKAQDKIENENILVTFSTCTIKDDWIIAIEKGLVFVEKAIKEERQFIRSDSNVLPIEKIRKTSKQSIQDLAKHSNYITHLPKEGSPSSVVPDQLLMIRKENDYAIYENKVLYALLIYLKDFIASRLNVIKETTNKYEAKSSLKKDISIGYRKLQISFDLHEVRKNDPIAIRKNACQPLIDRIDKAFSFVLGLLDTPLMGELSKADMVKRPITKTNILKMDRNYRESLTLFDFVADYDEPGYTVEKVVKSFSPLALDCVSDYTEIIMLISFITYQYGNSLSDELKKNYFLEEARRQAEAEDKLIEKLRNIHAKINLSGQTIDEYLLLFEEGYRVLEKRLDALNVEIKRIIAEHKKEIETLIEGHNRKIAEMKQAHEEEIAGLKADYENQIDEQKKKYEEEIRNLCDEHKKAIIELKDGYETIIADTAEKHRAEMENLKSEHAAEVAGLKNEFADRKNELEVTINGLNDEISQTKKDACDKVLAAEAEATACTKKATSDVEQAIYERDLAKGELIALRQQLDKPPLPEDFVSKERFDELEREREAFEHFFAGAWSATKKSIRKSLLGKQARPSTAKTKKKK